MISKSLLNPKTHILQYGNKQVLTDKNVLIVVAPILINKQVFEPNYDLKFMVWNWFLWYKPNRLTGWVHTLPLLPRPQPFEPLPQRDLSKPLQRESQQSAHICQSDIMCFFCLNSLPGLVKHSNNPSTWAVERGISGVQGKPQLHKELEASLGYMRPHSNF